MVCSGAEHVFILEHHLASKLFDDDLEILNNSYTDTEIPNKTEVSSLLEYTFRWADVSEVHTASIIRAKMEAVLTSETSAYFNVTTRRYILEDSKLHTRRRENLVSDNISTGNKISGLAF
jgi:head-tail adaptor